MLARDFKVRPWAERHTMSRGRLVMWSFVASIAKSFRIDIYILS